MVNKKQKKNLMVIGFLIGLLVVGGMIALPPGTVSDNLALGSTANCAVTIDYFGYFEGEPVYASAVQFSPWLFESGAEVDELAVTITWEATGENVDWDSFSVEVSFSFAIPLVDGTWKSVYPSDTSFRLEGATYKTGSYTWVTSIDSLVAGLEMWNLDTNPHYVVTGWTSLVARIDDVYGAAHTDVTQPVKSTWNIYPVGTNFDMSVEIITG